MCFYIFNSFRDIHCQNVPKTFETPCIKHDRLVQGAFLLVSEKIKRQRKVNASLKNALLFCSLD